MPSVGIRSIFGLATVTFGLFNAAGHSAFAANLPDVRLSSTNHVPACVTPERLTTFLRTRNPELDRRHRRLSGLYAKFGEKLHVRWDIAFFQMMVETANLSFRRSDGTSSDVALEHNNFAGIGAIGDGRPGEVFASQADGVQGHLEHVLHYAGGNVARPVANRTRKVQEWRVLASWHSGFDRPITFEDLARRWAPHTEAYLASIEHLASIYQRQFCGNLPLLMVEPRTRQPKIAKTAWSFRKVAGKPGSAGTIPPSGKPNLRARRKALGFRRVAATATIPPLPGFQSRWPITVTPKSPTSHAVRQPKKAARTRSVKISANDRVRQLISDRKILLRTHVGIVIPILYRGNGEVVGRAGSLAFFLGSSRDKGRWWVAKGKLCQKWRVWLDQETHCMTLTKRQGTIHWRADDGKSGTAKIVSR